MPPLTITCMVMITQITTQGLSSNQDHKASPSWCVWSSVACSQGSSLKKHGMGQGRSYVVRLVGGASVKNQGSRLGRQTRSVPRSSFSTKKMEPGIREFESQLGIQSGIRNSHLNTLLRLRQRSSHVENQRSRNDDATTTMAKLPKAEQNEKETPRSSNKCQTHYDTTLLAFPGHKSWQKGVAKCARSGRKRNNQTDVAKRKIDRSEKTSGRILSPRRRWRLRKHPNPWPVGHLHMGETLRSDSRRLRTQKKPPFLFI